MFISLNEFEIVCEIWLKVGLKVSDVSVKTVTPSTYDFKHVLADSHYIKTNMVQRKHNLDTDAVIYTTEVRRKQFDWEETERFASKEN